MAFLTYKNISLAASILTACLFMSLLAFPELIYWLFGIDSTDSADFMSKRAAMLFLGLSIITFTSRDAPPSSARSSICIGVSIMMLALAILGMFEFIIGNAGAGIWLAIAGELSFAAAYLKIWRNQS